MIEPRHRTIVDIEGKPLFGLAAERKPDRGLDRAAMADRDHILPRMLGIDAHNRATDTVVEVHEAFAARRRFGDIGKPVAAGGTARQKRGAVHPLPLSEMLFGKGRFL